MQRAIETFAVIQLSIIGLSHILHRHAWIEFFVWMRSRGATGAFVNGFLSLTIGSLILAFHRVWSGIPLLLTLFGVLSLVKAAQCFLLPAMSMRSMNRVSADRSYEFVAAGAVSLVLAGLVAFHLVRTA